MLVMVLLWAATSLGWFGPNPIGTTSTSVRPLLVPPGWAFSIWGPIYAGLVVFPIYQLIRNRNNHPLWVPLRRWYAANVVANGVWLVLASYDWQVATVVVIAFMLFSLLRIHQLFARLSAVGVDYSYWLERLVFSLYFGWITLATVLNVTTALYYYDWSGWGVAPVVWTLVMSGVVALIAGFTAIRFRDGVYALVVVWAFGALAVRHFGAGTQVLGWSSAAVAVGFVALAGWLLLDSKRTPEAQPMRAR